MANCAKINSEEGEPQQFKNDYTRIRNTVAAITLSDSRLKLTGKTNGRVTMGIFKSGADGWAEWAYFPNTNQLRNQYVANEQLGYPMCLSACSV